MLSLTLQGVKVQEMGDSYQFLLGADVLRGAAGLLEEVQVVTGSRVEWYDRRNDVRMITRLVNPVGPAGAPGVASTSPADFTPPKAGGGSGASSAVQRGTDRGQEQLPPPPPRGPDAAGAGG